MYYGQKVVVIPYLGYLIIGRLWTAQTLKHVAYSEWQITHLVRVLIIGSSLCASLGYVTVHEAGELPGEDYSTSFSAMSLKWCEKKK